MLRILSRECDGKNIKQKHVYIFFMEKNSHRNAKNVSDQCSRKSDL